MRPWPSRAADTHVRPHQHQLCIRTMTCCVGLQPPSALPACAEIASVQSHAESALVQLAAVREREQLQLSRRAEALQRDFREHLAELEHRYTLQVGTPCPGLPRHPRRMARPGNGTAWCHRSIGSLLREKKS